MVNVFTTHQLWIAAFCEMDEPFHHSPNCGSLRSEARFDLLKHGRFSLPSEIALSSTIMLRGACPRARKLRRLSKRYQGSTSPFRITTHLTVRGARSW